MLRVLPIDPDVLAARCGSLPSRAACRLRVEESSGRSRLVRSAPCRDCPAACRGGAPRDETVWPSLLAYRLAEFSMMAYADPAHHSAASDLVACRDRSLIFAGFVGDDIEGTEAEWADRLVGFVHLAVFLRAQPAGGPARQGTGPLRKRSFFSRPVVLSMLVTGDHFVTEIAAVAEDHHEVRAAVEALLEGRLDDREIDLYVSDVVLPRRDMLRPFWQHLSALKQTPGVGGFVAILVPTTSLVQHNAAFARLLERRARLMNMRRIAICPPQNAKELGTPQETWLGREIPASALALGYARARLWIAQRPYVLGILILAAFVLGSLADHVVAWLAGS